MRVILISVLPTENMILSACAESIILSAGSAKQQSTKSCSGKCGANGSGRGDSGSGDSTSSNDNCSDDTNGNGNGDGNSGDGDSGNGNSNSVTLSALSAPELIV